MKETVKPAGLNTWRTFRAVSTLALICAAAMPVRATVYAWTNAAALTTNWNNGGKWTPSGFPNATGDVANITNDVAGGQTIFLNQSTITVGTLNVGDAATPAYAVIITNNAIQGTLILDNNGSAAQVSQSVNSPGDTIAVPVQFVAGLAISNASSSKALTFSGPISGTGDIVIQTNAVALAPATDYVLSNNISGNGSLIKGGLANLTLTGTNAVALNANVGLSGGGTLTIGGGVFSNLMTGLNLPFSTDGSTLVVSNGARYFNPTNAAASYCQFKRTNCTLLVTGPNTVWNQGGDLIDMDLARNNFVITDGAVVTNTARVFVGFGSSANLNNLQISNGGRLFTTTGSHYLGYSASSNAITIGGTNAITGVPATWNTSAAGGLLSIGAQSAGANFNSLTVAAGGVFTNGGITAGSVAGSCFNSLIITNGGQVFTVAAGYIGSSGATNSGWVGGTNPANGVPSLWNVGAALILGNVAGAVGNVLRVDNGGVVTNVSGGSGLVVGNATGADGNTLIITNGGKMFISANGATIGSSGASGNALVLNNGMLMDIGSAYVGTGGSNNTVTVTGNSVWDIGANSLYIGSSSGTSPGLSNSVIVTAGGVLTNIATYSLAVGACTGANCNSLMVTNGGQLFMSSGQLSVGAYKNAAGGNSNTMVLGNSVLNNNGEGNIGYASSGNALTLTASSSWSLGNNKLWVGLGAAAGNAVLVDNGAAVANITTLTVGTTNTSANNSLTIANNGSLAAAVVVVGGSTGGSVAPNNVVLITTGGLLETTNLTVGAASGNAITNAGGIYQFTVKSPTVTPNGNVIALNGGTIAFRALATADVLANMRDTLINMTFSGTNAFRLNAASNTTALTQSYLFDPGSGATNFARLEMVSGATRYRGLAGDTLTIGRSSGSGGQMLCSNTAATVAMIFTNNGTLTIVNSTLTLTTNAVFNGALAIDLTRLATTAGVISAQRSLTLGTNSTLAFVGTPTTNAVMLTTASGYTGRFGSVTGLPPSYSVSYAGNTVAIRYAPVGTVFFFR